MEKKLKHTQWWRRVTRGQILAHPHPHPPIPVDTGVGSRHSHGFANG